MSILNSTNSGIRNLSLTPEIAKSLGWIIDREDGQNTGINANGKPNNWKCIDMKYKDATICAPLRFWYEPQDKIKYISFEFWFFGQKELGIGTEGINENARVIEKTGQLLDCLEFVKMADKHGREIQHFWQSKLKQLKRIPWE